MSTSTSTRLGQILVDKGLITTAQLEFALNEQKKRRQSSEAIDKNHTLSLGEVLIELGFIDRLQLKRGLNWQLMLRKAAIVMSFCAPLMTVSVGAAAGTSFRPGFTVEESSSSEEALVPGFTKTSSSASSVAVSSAASSIAKSSSSSSSKAAVSSSSKSSSSKANDFTGLKMSEITLGFIDHEHVQLKWTSIQGANIVGYRIFRDQVQIDFVEASRISFDDYNVASSRNYLYGISVGDAAGNWSPVKSILVQTKAAPKGVEIKSSSSSSVASQASSSQPNFSQTSSAPSISSSSKAASSTASVASSSVAVSSASSSKVSSSASSAPVSSSSSSKSSVASSSSSVASSSSSTSSSAASQSETSVIGPVNFSWEAPNLRENGNPLDITEVGGYEFRYRKTSDSAFTYVTIKDAWKNYHNFTWLEGTYVFQIAAFDTNGLYSNFVDIKPK